MRRLGACLALLVGGCAFSAEFAEGFRCPTGDCPAGQVCNAAQVCVPIGEADPDAAAPPHDAAVPLPDAPPPDAPPPDAMPPNLCPNPGMEDGVVEWTPYNATAAANTNVPHSGTLALKICKQPTMATSLMSVYVDVINPAAPGDLSVGARFVASIWVRSSFAIEDVAPPQLMLSLREAGGAAANHDHDGTPLLAPTTDWTLITAEGVIQQPDRTRLSLIVAPGDVPDGTCFLIDDCHVARLP